MTPADPMPCLVVDDEPRLRRVLVRLLEAQGFACAEAGSGTEALAQLERAPVPLVISDIRMPQMDGITLLKEIVARWPDTAVVVVTAVAEVESAVACLQLGALEEKDPYLRGHSMRVAGYAVGIARELGLDGATLDAIALGAELHDLGKIGVSEAVLHKPGPLTDAEYRHIMEHPVIGARILAPLMRDAPAALAIVRSHHERLDGRGFPDGLKGEAIPLEVRIATVADSFDAMTSLRPYRPALSVARALAELEEGKGVQFDARAVEAFRAAFPDASRLPVTAPAVRPLHLPGPAASD